MNPGSLHFDPADGSNLMPVAGATPAPATSVASISNNPSAVTSD